MKEEKAGSLPKYTLKGAMVFKITETVYGSCLLPVFKFDGNVLAYEADQIVAILNKWGR